MPLTIAEAKQAFKEKLAQESGVSGNPKFDLLFDKVEELAAKGKYMAKSRIAYNGGQAKMDYRTYADKRAVESYFHHFVKLIK